MRPRGDQERRRADVAEAVWRVLVAGGFLGLTMRAVAAELGATTGVVTHYFRSKDELIAFALDLLDRRSAGRQRRPAEPGLPALRSAVLDMLPLDEASADANRIWVGSWGVALPEEALRAAHAGRYAASRGRLAELVAAAQRAGHLRSGDPGDAAEQVHAFVLGLIVQALLDPGAYPPERQAELIDRRLAGLR